MFVVEFTLIVLAVLAAISIVITSAITGISPMPSSKKAREVVFRLVETIGDSASAMTIVDLGSGWGSLVIRLAKAYPDRQVVGYELSPIPWLVSLCIARCLGLNNLVLKRRDYLEVDFPVDSILICYLYPEGMKAIGDKLLSMSTDSETANRYLISNNFALSSHTPQETIQLDDFYLSPIYLYRL